MSQTETYTCNECENMVLQEHRFCANCGSWQGVSTESINLYNSRPLRNAVAFYLLDLLLIIFIRTSPWFADSYGNLFWAEWLLAAFAVLFTLTIWKQIKPLLLPKWAVWKQLFWIVPVGIAASLLVNYLVSNVNIALFERDSSYYEYYKIYEPAWTVMVYSIAIMPALFEELAYRGVLYQYLGEFLDEDMVVVLTAFIFALAHLSPVSILWIFPFGLLLGWLRKKYNTLWLGVALHFIFNLTACCIDLYKEGYFN
jgi:uncharacterized protein